MNSITQHIDLKLHVIQSKPISYHFENGYICLFITAENGVEMPMGQRSVPLPAQSVYLFYDQNRSFDLSFVAEQKAILCIIKLSIDTLHHIIGQGTDELNFSQSAIFEQERYHHFEPANSGIQQHLSDLISNPTNLLIREAKKFEILNAYFNTKSIQNYKCPFLNQKDNVNKVRDAKQHLISNLQESLTIKQLAKLVGLNEHNLKTGFKEIYGKPVHGYLKDFKISKAKEMIETKEYQINEVADYLGYTNVSHFIDAFKKKHGKTPKQFELSLGEN